VPLYNEEDRLRESAPEIAAFIKQCARGSRLILSDDGSTDTTVETCRELADSLGVPVTVVAGAHRGKGATVQAGLEAARTPLVAFCDVDLATPLREMQRIVASAASAPALAIGSRDVVSTRLVHREGEVREFFGKAFNRLLRTTLTPGIYDT